MVKQRAGGGRQQGKKEGKKKFVRRGWYISVEVSKKVENHPISGVENTKLTGDSHEKKLDRDMYSKVRGREGDPRSNVHPYIYICDL